MERKKVEKARNDLVKAETEINILLERIRGEDGNPRYFKEDLGELNKALEAYEATSGPTIAEFLTSSSSRGGLARPRQEIPSILR